MNIADDEIQVLETLGKAYRLITKFVEKYNDEIGNYEKRKLETIIKHLHKFLYVA